MALLISFSYGQSPTVPGRPKPAKPVPTQTTSKPKPQAKPAQKNKPVSKTTTKQRPQTKDTKPPATTNSKPRAVDRSYGQWVDLGLPSGTLWKNANETNPGDDHDFYTYDEAVQKFGDKLPTKAQLRELKDKCTWTWSSNKKGYKVAGRNGNSIFLPAAGIRGCYSGVDYVGSYGHYWSSTPRGSDAWYLGFDSGGVHMDDHGRCDGLSLRLVQD